MAQEKTALELVIDSHATCVIIAAELGLQLAKAADFRRVLAERREAIAAQRAKALHDVNISPEAGKTESAREAAAAVLLEADPRHVEDRKVARNMEHDARVHEASAEAHRERLAAECVYMAALARLGAVDSGRE